MTEETLTLTETEEEREEREFRARAIARKAAREEWEAFVPAVGTVLWKLQRDPFWVAPERPENARMWRKPEAPDIAVGYKVVRVTPTRVTLEDKSAYILYPAGSKGWRTNIQETYSGDGGVIWRAYEYGRPYGGSQVYALPPEGKTAWLKADLDAKVKADHEAKADAANKARREKLEEVGLRACILDIFNQDSYLRRSELDSLFALLDEDQQRLFHWEILEIALDSTRELNRVAEAFERLGNEAQRRAEEFRRVS